MRTATGRHFSPPSPAIDATGLLLLPFLLLSFRRSRLTIGALTSLCILVLLFVVLARVYPGFLRKEPSSFVPPPLCTHARKFSLAIIMSVCDLTAANSCVSILRAVNCLPLRVSWKVIRNCQNVEREREREREKTDVCGGTKVCF